MQSLFQMKNVHYLSHPWYLDTLEINTGSMHKYEFGFECLCLFQTFFHILAKLSKSERSSEPSQN